MKYSRNNCISVDFHALFIARDSDAMVKALLQQIKQPKSYLNVKVVIPYNQWHYKTTFDTAFFTNAFTSFIEPKLAAIFGKVYIELTYSKHLKGNNVSIVWGPNINYEGKFGLYLNKQRLLNFDDNCVIDTALANSFGFEVTQPFVLQIDEKKLDLVEGGDDYLVYGLSLTDKNSDNKFQFTLRKEAECS